MSEFDPVGDDPYFIYICVSFEPFARGPEARLHTSSLRSVYCYSGSLFDTASAADPLVANTFRVA